MTVTMNLETRQRALSEWWTEETDYIFQRFERWAAYAKGYNRLRSRRISNTRMSIQENNSSSRWSFSGNKLFIEEASWNPRFQTLNRSHASKSQPEELKLNCCGSLNYKSNAKLDSTCLETYSYDHSIYFKTIGDLKTKSTQDLGKRSQDSEEGSLDFQVDFGKMDNEDFEEKIEWKQPRRKDRFDKLTFIDSFDEEDEEVEYSTRWPVDFSKLSIDEVEQNRNNQNRNNQNCNNQNLGEDVEDFRPDQNQNQERQSEFNVNFDDGLKDVNDNFQLDLNFGNPLRQSRSFPELQDFHESRNSKYSDSKVSDSENPNQKEVERLFNPRRKSNNFPVFDDDNIVWPGVLLTYKKDIDFATSAHRHAESVRGSDCYFISGS